MGHEDGKAAAVTFSDVQPVQHLRKGLLHRVGELRALAHAKAQHALCAKGVACSGAVVVQIPRMHGNEKSM